MVTIANYFILLLHCGSNVFASHHPYVEIFKIFPEPQPVMNATFNITVDLKSSHHACHRQFVSVTIDTYAIKTRWNELAFSSRKLQTLASALTPSSIRLGGTYSDFMIFDPNAAESDLDELEQKPNENDYLPDAWYFECPKNLPNFTLTGSQWSNLTEFLSKVGWDILFDFNLFLSKGGFWDSTNAELLLNYSSERGIKIPYFQLGNEPNSYYNNFHLNITPETLVKDFGILKSIVSYYPLYNNSHLVGPDVTNLNRKHHGLEYLSEFLSSKAYKFVSIISLHHYYFSCRRAKIEDFINITVMDSLNTELTLAVETVNKCPVKLAIVLTETTSCFGGGAPNMSDAYVGGFLWLDKLGLSAQFGISKVFRQTFIGGCGGLLDDRHKPNPDYYITLLFKKLIEGPVFSVSTEPADPQLRVYANCAGRQLYKAGALVIYYLNLREEETILDMPQFRDADLDLYLLTPGDEKGLLSRTIKLNGELLVMSKCCLPPMLPKPHRGKVAVEALSFGFIVVPYSNVTLCTKYFAYSAYNNY